MKTVLIILLLIPCSAFSQPEKIIKVLAGNDPLPSFPMSERYRYKDFLEGFVFDADGKPTKLSKMNLQIVSGTLEVIQENGDTVVLNDKTILYKNILIRSDFFLCTEKDGYFNILGKGEPAKLVSKLRWTIIGRDQVENTGIGQGAYSSRTESTRPDPVTNLPIKNEYLVYKKIMTYFLMDSKENTDFVSKANFVKMFPNHKKEIKEFINKNEIDFDNEQDLKKLHKYCVSLN